MNEKQIIKEEVEEKFINTILSFVTEEGLTITNIKESIEKVYSYMEDNAILQKDYLER